ncbi:MAG TPA: fimbria/pilus outer membrane usher protein [Rhizomicrobium sp.]
MPQTLILEIWVNGTNTHVIASLVNRGATWWANRADLVAAGVNVTAKQTARDGRVSLFGFDGIKAEIDSADQRLTIEARPDCLAAQVLDLRAQRAASAQPSATSGFIASYQVAGTIDDFRDPSVTSGANAALSATYFASPGTVTATGFAQLQDGASQFVRLDTTAEFDQPDLLRRWLVGDAISGGLSWSRSVRFGGVQLGTDFTLQPGLTTMPLPAFFGQTAVPGSVDVYVNSARVFEGDVAPGPFQIQNLPVITGNGQATVVVRNVLGEETTQTFSFYATNALLEQGLTDYDLDAGFLRQSYGLQSFDYRQPVATATYRYGFSDWLTVESHGEAASSVQLLGGGGALALGTFGELGADAAFSNSGLGRGALYSVSFDSQAQLLGVFGSVSAAANHYTDLASIGGMVPSRLRTQLGADMNFDRSGSFAVSWISIKDNGSVASQLASASYTLSFNRGWYFGATALHDCAGGAWGAQLSLSIPLGGGAIATASAQAAARANQFGAGIAQPTDPDGGFGYDLSVLQGDIRTANGEATWIGDRGSLDAAVSSVNGQTAGRLSASGAIVEMNGSTFATRNPEGSVALVETGEPNIPVYRENRQVATSDPDGEALLTGLVANAPNRIGIDPTDYAFGSVVDTTEQILVPRRQSGVVVDLAPRHSRPALVVLQLANGEPPPVGAQVTLTTGGNLLLVGHHGQVFISHLDRRTEGVAAWPNGSCRFTVDPPKSESKNVIPRLGPLLCDRVTQNGD